MAGQYTRRFVLKAGGLVLSVNAAGALASLRAASPHILMLKADSGRPIAVTHWRPRKAKGAVLFSHGAFSAPSFYDPLLIPLVHAGYEIWAPLHVDSRLYPDQRAFSGSAVFAARMEDMRVVARHIGSGPYMTAGHSYGGLIALTLAGASPVSLAGPQMPFLDPRVSAVIAFSPPGPMPGFVDPGCYTRVARPAFIQTGTRDMPAPNGTSRPDPNAWRKHLMAFDEAAPLGHRYALIVDGVDHYFGGAICDFDRPGPPQLRQAREAAKLATIFADTYAMGSRRAGRVLVSRLSGSGPSVLLTK